MHAPAVLGTSVNLTTQELLSLTNQKRQKEGLEQLTLNDQLTQAATLKAQNMFQENYWAHNAPDGITPWIFFKNVGYDYIYAGENLARGFTNADEVVNAWMASPSHRENMLSPNYKEVGFAVMEGKLLGEDTTLVVEMFGRKDVVTKTAKNEPSTKRTASIAAQSSMDNRQNPIKTNTLFVTGVKSSPVVDTKALSWSLSLILIALFIFILVLDIIVIERKKIKRFVGHSFDHIVFLIAVFLFMFMLSQGFVL